MIGMYVSQTSTITRFRSTILNFDLGGLATVQK